MGKAKNSAAILIVVTTMFAIVTVSDGANSSVTSVTPPLQNTTAVTQTVSYDANSSVASVTPPPQMTTAVTRIVSDGVNSFVTSEPPPPHNTTVPTQLQNQHSNDQFVTMLEQLLQNPKIIGNFLESLVPAFTNILKSSLSGANNSATPSSQAEALLGNWLSGLGASGNGSSSALGSEFGKFEAHALGTVEKYLDEPIVKDTLLPLMTRVINILREVRNVFFSKYIETEHVICYRSQNEG